MIQGTRCAQDVSSVKDVVRVRGESTHFLLNLGVATASGSPSPQGLPKKPTHGATCFLIIAHLIVRLKGLDAWSSNMHVVAFIVLDERGYLVGPLTHDQPMTHACRIQSHKLRRLCPPSLPMSCGLQRGARAGAKTGILEEMEETQDLEC